MIQVQISNLSVLKFELTFDERRLGKLVWELDHELTVMEHTFSDRSWQVEQMFSGALSRKKIKEVQSSDFMLETLL